MLVHAPGALAPTSRAPPRICRSLHALWPRSTPRTPAPQRTAEDAGSRSHGINRARQQLAEALAAEDRADAAACDDWWPGAWDAEELAAAEQEAEGNRGGVDAEPWDDMDDVETYNDAGVTAEVYLREDVLHATPLEQAGGLTTEQRRLVAENHVRALEGKQRREKEEAERAAATHAAATAAAEGEWQRRNTEALDTRRAADARVRATADDVPISWTTEYRDAKAKDAARAAAAHLKALAQDAERAAQEENALRARDTAMRLDQARATLARRKIELGEQQAALTTVDGTWQSGRVGTGSPAAGRTGGLLVEAITRHRLRISSRTDDNQPRGCVCFLWVKAHGGMAVSLPRCRRPSARTCLAQTRALSAPSASPSWMLIRTRCPSVPSCRAASRPSISYSTNHGQRAGAAMVYTAPRGSTATECSTFRPAAPPSERNPLWTWAVHVRSSACARAIWSHERCPSHSRTCAPWVWGWSWAKLMRIASMPPSFGF